MKSVIKLPQIASTINFNTFKVLRLLVGCLGQQGNVAITNLFSEDLYVMKDIRFLCLSTRTGVAYTGGISSQKKT